MDKCTIFGPVFDAKRVKEILIESFPGCEVEIKGSSLEWDSLEVKTENSRLVLNSKVRKVPGDDFSRLIMSTHTHLSRMPQREGKDRVLQAVLSTRWMIGVISDPGFSNDPSHEKCVFKICQQLGGMVFNGQSMISDSGDKLLTPAI